ncbi:uncharacterized protein [Diabrotica undecimpunctata]|uniref:uncharacterized protein n=1 Tax=Diabrotica undecimpunctata TaxID=50387 RepID=UPI003B63417D
MKKYKDMLFRAQRKPLIRVCSAYRTVSIIALKVVAGSVPVHILARERARMYQRGNGAVGSGPQERARSLEMWQREWAAEVEKAAWTRSLVPDVVRIGRSGDDLCPECGVVDDAQHVVFDCPAYHTGRNELQLSLGSPLGEPHELIDKAIASKHDFELIIAFVTKTIKHKEEKERRLQMD